MIGFITHYVACGMAPCGPKLTEVAADTDENKDESEQLFANGDSE